MVKRRHDSSLGLVTKSLLNLLQKAENGILDLNHASVTLSVSKRRIYDITHVLEGIGLLTKISKNNIKWNGSDGESNSHNNQCDLRRDLRRDLNDLEKEDNMLDELISSIGLSNFLILLLQLHH